MLPDELMNVALGGEAGSDVDELRDAGFCDQKTDCVLEKLSVFQCGQRQIGRGCEN